MSRNTLYFSVLYLTLSKEPAWLFINITIAFYCGFNNIEAKSLAFYLVCLLAVACEPQTIIIDVSLLFSIRHLRILSVGITRDWTGGHISSFSCTQ